MRSRLLTLSIGAALIAACATNPVTGKRELALMSEAQEVALGQQADAEVRKEMGVYEDADLQRYVSDIGKRMAKISHRPSLPWSFAVVDEQAVNAFALPGGFIYVTRGLLAHMNDEAELAGVIGHEIGHVTARHSVQQYSQQQLGGIGLLAAQIFVPATRPFGDLASTALGLTFLKFGRDDELQSDALGVEYAARGGWDPTGVPRFLETLSRLNEMSVRGVPTFLSTHPDPGSRVADARPLAKKFSGPQADAVNRDAFLRRIDGIMFGDNPKEGVVRGNAFLHPELRFALQFPPNWEVQNSPQQVVAKAPEQPFYMLLQLVQQPQGRTIEEVAATSMGGAGFRRVDGERARINGLDAYVGLYTGALEGLGNVVMRAAHIAQDGRVYVFAGFAPEQAFRSVDGALVQSIRSFREMSAREAAEIRPNRVDFHVVRQGDTWQSIAERDRVVSAQTLAIMNGYPPNRQPRPGERVKIVVNS